MGKTLKNSQRTIAAVSVASMALLNVGIMAPANAAVSKIDASTADLGNSESIPQTANLKITKRTPDENTAGSRKKANGTAISPLPGKAAIEGVTFTLYKIEGIDLTKNEDWVKANAASKVFNAMTDAEKREATEIVVPAGEGAGTYAISKKKVSGDTGADGVVQFQVSDGDRGLYVVRETITKDVTVDGETYKPGSVVKSAPFVVALPMTDQNDTSKWLGTVNVYPKNSVTDITKEVKDSETPGSGNDNPDSNITYTIKTGVPQDTDFDTYMLIDPLDSRLAYQSSAFKALDKNGAAIDTISFEKGKDYTIVAEADDQNTANPASPTGDGDKVGTWVTVRFLKDGITKLKTAGVKKLQWDLTANIGDTTGKTDIENQAFLVPDNEGAAAWNDKPTPGNPEVPGTPSNEVVSKYGKVTINKVDEDGNARNDAEFELYTCSKDKTLQTKVKVDNKDKWVSGTDGLASGDGKIVIDGLQLNDFKNGSEGKTKEEAEANGLEEGKGWKDKSFYCLKEVKAPAGYELLPEVIQFQLLQDDQDFSKELTIENVPNNGGFDLPLTGGKGIFGLVALGALLVLGSIGYIFLASRRRQES